jgi:hypothetical protein
MRLTHCVPPAPYDGGSLDRIGRERAARRVVVAPRQPSANPPRNPCLAHAVSFLLRAPECPVIGPPVAPDFVSLCRILLSTYYFL